MHTNRYAPPMIALAALAALGLFPLTPAAAQSLYVANGNNTIEKYAFSGGTLSSTGVQFTASGLNLPYALAFDNAGNLFTTNNGTSTIEEYANSGGTLSSTGVQFTASGLNSPSGLAFSPIPAPEPSAWVSLGIGAAGLLGLGIRARRPTPAR